MLKVLFLIHDLGQGGAEKVLVNLVNNMDRSKFDISVTVLFGGGVNEQFLAPDIHFHSVFPKEVPGNSKLMKLLTPRQLHKLCVKEHYDIEVSYLEGPSARVISGCRIQAPNWSPGFRWNNTRWTSMPVLSAAKRKPVRVIVSSTRRFVSPNTSMMTSASSWTSVSPAGCCITLWSLIRFWPEPTKQRRSWRTMENPADCGRDAEAVQRLYASAENHPVSAG